jgi:hypothetical protein
MYDTGHWIGVRRAGFGEWSFSAGLVRKGAVGNGKRQMGIGGWRLGIGSVG